MHDEIFWVVDEHDVPLRIVYGKDYLHENGFFHRAVHVFIEVFGGYFIVQQKAKHTENGGLLSSSVSGHVRYGESYLEAAIRETKEELGLDVESEELEEIAYVSACGVTNNEFVKLYSYLLDPTKEVITINEEELDGIIILPLGELIEDIADNPNKYSPAFKFLLNIFLTYNKDIVEASYGSY